MADVVDQCWKMVFCEIGRIWKRLVAFGWFNLPIVGEIFVKCLRGEPPWLLIVLTETNQLIVLCIALKSSWVMFSPSYGLLFIFVWIVHWNALDVFLWCAATNAQCVIVVRIWWYTNSLALPVKCWDKPLRIRCVVCTNTPVSFVNLSLLFPPFKSKLSARLGARMYSPQWKWDHLLRTNFHQIPLPRVIPAHGTSQIAAETERSVSNYYCSKSIVEDVFL